MIWNWVHKCKNWVYFLILQYFFDKSGSVFITKSKFSIKFENPKETGVKSPTVIFGICCKLIVGDLFEVYSYCQNLQIA